MDDNEKNTQDHKVDNGLIDENDVFFGEDEI